MDLGVARDEVEHGGLMLGGAITARLALDPPAQGTRRPADKPHPNSPRGWKKICPKASPSSRCRSHIKNGCARPTRSNGSIRNSRVTPASPGSFPTKLHSCAWSPRCSAKSAKPGKPTKFTSTCKTKTHP